MGRVGSSRRGFVARWALVLGSVLGIALLQGCGGGAGGAQASAPVAVASTGQLTVGVRDAAGDFVTYAVDVTSLRLERANGDVVETVPFTTRIDFALLVDLTEFLTVTTVPAGVYSRAVVGLDFTNAQIVVQDANGAAVPVVAIGTDGKPLTTLSVAIQLPDDGRVHIAAGVPAACTLDFDLAASNTIDLAANPAQVTVQPFLAVIPELDGDRAHRARGLLASVDKPAASVTLKVRPFHHRQGEFGRLTFATAADTQWEIDGEPFAGVAGLEAIAALAVDSPVVAQGTVANGSLSATTVLAGTSVPWAHDDVVGGVVTARSGDTLTVRGVDVDFRDGVHALRGAFDVLVGDATHVTAIDAQPDSLDKGAISIGQRIVAFGTLTDAQTLDATAGRVRLEITPLEGDVVQVNPLVLNLVDLGGLRPGAFDFAGTGVSAATDADPAHYEIDTTTLALAAVSVGDRLRVRGLVHAFALAPPDFDARTVIATGDDPVGAHLQVSWRAIRGSATPFANLSADRIDVDLSDARHSLHGRAALDAADRIVLLGPADGRGMYLVADRGRRQLNVYRGFAELTRALSDRLAAGDWLVEIGANGRYNAPAMELTTPWASFEFTTP